MGPQSPLQQRPLGSYIFSNQKREHLFFQFLRTENQGRGGYGAEWGLEQRDRAPRLSQYGIWPPCHPYQPRGQGCPHSWGLRSGYRVCSQGLASRVTVTPLAFCPKLSLLIS